MPASFEFLRGVLGVLCVLFAYMAGRSAAGVRKGAQKVSKLYGWILRAMACAVVVGIRHPLDAIDILVWVLTLAAAVLGWWSTSREKKDEDLTHEIFPE